MREKKFTPGPWKKDGLGWYGANGEQVVMSDGPSFGSRSCFNQAEPNAHLIAAAPELLEALEYCLNRIEKSEKWWIDVESKGGFDTDKIELAIAKAYGETK